MEFKINIIKKKDIKEIRRIARIIWFHTYPGIITLNQIEYMLKKNFTNAEIIYNQNSWIKAVVKNNIVAFLNFVMKEDYCEIKKLYILPTLHRKKIGTSLINHIKKLSKQNDLNHISLRVNKNNIKAIAFYYRQTFYILKPNKLKISDEFFMDDYIMKHDLKKI